MNQAIKQRTQKKIKQNEEAKSHVFIMNSREYEVFPNVFSPSIFLGTEWLTNALIKHLSQNCNLIQIGVGCGCTLVELLLSNKFNQVSGVDINPHAVQNTLYNLKKYSLKSSVLTSDVLSNPQINNSFETVYWNYPFHPSNKSWDSLSFIEKSVMDPSYSHLIKLLEQSIQKNVKQIFLGFSMTMGDYKFLSQIAERYQMVPQIIDKMDENKGTIALIKISRIQFK